MTLMHYAVPIKERSLSRTGITLCGSKEGYVSWRQIDGTWVSDTAPNCDICILLVFSGKKYRDGTKENMI